MLWHYKGSLKLALSNINRIGYTKYNIKCSDTNSENGYEPMKKVKATTWCCSESRTINMFHILQEVGAKRRATVYDPLTSCFKIAPKFT